MPDLENVKICFSIPASPTAGFYAQIAMFRMALDALGGHYRDADILVFFGHENEEQPPLPDKWTDCFGRNVKFNWVSAEEFRLKSYLAQGDARWRYDYAGYDLVIFSDADTLMLNPIDDLILLNLQQPAVNGVITYLCPPHDGFENPQLFWNSLSNDLLGFPLEFAFRHSLEFEREPEFAYCPYNVNFGFIMVPTGVLKQFAHSFLEMRPEVASLLSLPYFSAQIGLALTLAKENIPVRAISPRYNYPNHPFADKYRINELRDIRLIHYLVYDHFNRNDVFASADMFYQFLYKQLEGSDAVFQAYISKLTGGFYPFN